MSEPNVHKNVKLAKFYPSDGSGPYTITSVIDVRQTDATPILTAGSDNDSRNTFVASGVKATNGELRQRDPTTMLNVYDKLGIFVFVCANQNPGGKDKVVEINPCLFPQPANTQAWQQLGEASSRFEGGSAVVTMS
jgi:hypothetical protein